MIRERILTIDDDPDILDVLELTLSEHYDITQASNGKEGLECVKKVTPDHPTVRAARGLGMSFGD